MTTIAIIQARLSSSRLPGKVLLPLVGRPLIWHIYQRALQCKEVGEVCIATSTEESDNPLVDFCQSAGLNVYRGSLDNVLQRFLDIDQICQEKRGGREQDKGRYLVRITGDCPLIEPSFIDSQLRALEEFDGDICWIEESTPVLEGQGAMNWRSLYKVQAASSHPDDCEHVGSPWIADHPQEFRIVEMVLPETLRRCKYRLTVDKQEDYDSIAEIYSSLYQGAPIPLKEVLAWLKSHPQVMRNREVVQSAVNTAVQEKRKRWRTAAKAGRREFCYEELCYE